jgi:hypothetical protein
MAFGKTAKPPSRPNGIPATAGIQTIINLTQSPNAIAARWHETRLCRSLNLKVLTFLS